MRLLLDTHVLLALLDGQIGKLGRGIERVVESDEHAFLVSVASFWEIAIKWRLGKLALAVPPLRLPPLLGDLGLAILAISAEQVLATVEPEPLTRDPFDRLLLAVCQTEDLRLLTVDRVLVAHRLAATLTP
jgi:PIN domain nuclease of toxin-antitoxin system